MIYIWTSGIITLMDIFSLFKSRALSIVVLVAGFLLFFGVMTQFSWDGITTFYIAAFTLGLCGLPTTFAGVVIWVGGCRALHFLRCCHLLGCSYCDSRVFCSPVVISGRESAEEC